MRLNVGARRARGLGLQGSGNLDLGVDYPEPLECNSSLRSALW